MGVLFKACRDVSDPEVARAVLESLENAASLDSLDSAVWRRALAELPPGLKKRGESLLARLDDKQAERRQALEQQLANLAAGDVKSGRETFFGKKAACSGCHTVGGRGGRVGPDLTTIGDIRQRGDLLESIVMPSATLARGFRSFTVVTTAGRVHTGVISRETTREIWIRSADLSETRVVRAEIEAIKESETSIMPRGLDKTLSRKQLADLVAFLRSCRAGNAQKPQTTPASR